MGYQWDSCGIHDYEHARRLALRVRATTPSDKRKGYAEVRLNDGTDARAELHWYEATGIGKREFKIKRFL